MRMKRTNLAPEPAGMGCSEIIRRINILSMNGSL